MAHVSLARFKSAAKKGESVPNAVLHKQMTMAVEPVDDRRVKFTISTGSVDRDKDTVAVDGWDLAPYEANPVVLWGHDSNHLPIGKCVGIAQEGNALKAIVEFVPADMPHIGEKAEAVLRMCRTGFLSATSVGFRPLKYVVASDRGDDDWFPPVDFLKQELMEFSIVSIPANPEALIDPSERMLAAAEAASEKEMTANLVEKINEAQVEVEAEASKAKAEQFEAMRLARVRELSAARLAAYP